MKKLLEKLLEKLARWIARQNAAADAARAAETSGGSAAETSAPAQTSAQAQTSGGIAAAPLGLASCWDGPNASRRMMNVLSPKMPDAKFREYVAWMLARGCDTAHVILANGGDGECAGYAAWRDADLPVMLLRVQRLRDAGLVVIPWIIADDSKDLLHKLFADPAKLIGKMRGLLNNAPCVVIGLEMDEGGNASQWKAVRDAIRKYYSGPLGVHHTSGNSFPFASLGDVILGQLNPGCSEAQVKNQIKAIRAKGKRAIGFEYARGANRKLAQAALDAGAEGVGNW